MPTEDSLYHRQAALLISMLPYVAHEEYFALKGGTAINLFVRNMPRLSVDIDLTYLPVEGRDESLRAISQALGRIAAAIEKAHRGTTVQCVGGEDQALKLLVQRERVQIKIEVSPVLRGSVRAASKRGVCPAVEKRFGYAEIQVLHEHDLYAGKLCAALDRQHPRDLFDVHMLLEAEGISDDLLDVFLIYLISSDRPIAELLAPRFAPLATTFDTQFRGMALQEVPLPVLEKTREMLVRSVNERLTEAQRTFLISFKTGEPDWNLLSLEGAEALPGVQWKLQNIRRMRKQKHQNSLDRLKKVLFGEKRRQLFD